MVAMSGAAADGSRTGWALGRRALLGAALGAVAAAALGRPSQAGALGEGEAELFEPMRSLGAPVSEYGSRSRFETAGRYLAPTATPYASASMTPLDQLYGIITPSSLHFERHHAGVPTVHPAHYRLVIHGLVERPRMYTLPDLKRFPSVSVIYFVECAGNSQSGWRPGRPDRTVQMIHGLTSCSEWTGVPLSTLLKEVGVKPGARWLLAEGMDGAAYARSLPIEKAWQDVLVAYGQNGEALRPEQGYPVRLIVPGWEGSIMVKWLRRIEVSDRPFMTREETARYTDLMPDGTARQFTWVMDAKSVITWPSGGHRLPERGFWEITGLAWSGRGRIVRVEVSTDGGRTWGLAELQQPVLPLAHTRFRFPWHWNGEEAILQSRATDETGYVQPTRAALIARRGSASLYHYNGIQSWRVSPDGRVTHVDA